MACKGEKGGKGGQTKIKASVFPDGCDFAVSYLDYLALHHKISRINFL